ncbi:MAG: hypothetical protein HC836_23100 [Richelia sp. RM2_1_2]|nr:hypothetical protein [Richelia sp. RM2_1_2]
MARFFKETKCLNLRKINWFAGWLKEQQFAGYVELAFMYKPNGYFVFSNFNCAFNFSNKEDLAMVMMVWKSNHIDDIK